MTRYLVHMLCFNAEGVATVERSADVSSQIPSLYPRPLLTSYLHHRLVACTAKNLEFRPTVQIQGQLVTTNKHKRENNNAK